MAPDNDVVTKRDKKYLIKSGLGDHFSGTPPSLLILTTHRISTPQQWGSGSGRTRFTEHGLPNHTHVLLLNHILPLIFKLTTTTPFGPWAAMMTSLWNVILDSPPQTLYLKRSDFWREFCLLLGRFSYLTCQHFISHQQSKLCLTKIQACLITFRQSYGQMRMYSTQGGFQRQPAPSSLWPRPALCMTESTHVLMRLCLPVPMHCWIREDTSHHLREGAHARYHLMRTFN